MTISRMHAEGRTMAAALTAVLHEGDGADELAMFFGSDEERELFAGLLSQARDIQARGGEDAARLKLGSLRSSETFSGIAEIHPAWIYEALKDESPRIMGIIMRYLPSRQVRYVLEHLPPEVKKSIPQLIEAFAVPRDVLDIIRRCFESRFLPIHISKARDHFDFEKLYYLKTDEIEQLMIELGLCELAMALDGMPDRMLDVLLNRLELKDAQRLHQRMNEVKGFSKELKRQARFALLEIDEENVGSERLLAKIGLMSLARAMAGENGDLLPMLKQKLDLRTAYNLSRAIDECRPGCTEEHVEARRNVVCASIARLASEHKIDTQWVRFAETA